MGAKSSAKFKKANKGAMSLLNSIRGAGTGLGTALVEGRYLDKKPKGTGAKRVKAK